MIDTQVSVESLHHVAPKIIPVIDLAIIHAIVITHVTDDLIDAIVVNVEVARRQEIAVEVAHHRDAINVEEIDALHRHRDAEIGEAEALGTEEMNQLGIVMIGMVSINHNHEMMIWLSMDFRAVVVIRDHQWTPLNTTHKNGRDLMGELHMVLNASVVSILKH